MKPLSELFLKACEFDDELDSTDGDNPKIKYLHQPRIQPILSACAEVVAACERTEAIYNFESFKGENNNHPFVAMGEALTRLREVLEKQ